MALHPNKLPLQLEHLHLPSTNMDSAVRIP